MTLRGVPGVEFDLGRFAVAAEVHAVDPLCAVGILEGAHAAKGGRGFRTVCGKGTRHVGLLKAPIPEGEELGAFVANTQETVAATTADELQRESVPPGCLTVDGERTTDSEWMPGKLRTAPLVDFESVLAATNQLADPIACHVRR